MEGWGEKKSRIKQSNLLTQRQAGRQQREPETLLVLCPATTLQSPASFSAKLPEMHSQLSAFPSVQILIELPHFEDLSKNETSFFMRIRHLHQFSVKQLSVVTVAAGLSGTQHSFWSRSPVPAISQTRAESGKSNLSRFRSALQRSKTQVQHFEDDSLKGKDL